MLLTIIRTDTKYKKNLLLLEDSIMWAKTTTNNVDTTALDNGQVSSNLY